MTPVIAIAGLPGSGKTTLLQGLQRRGYSIHDDVNEDWATNLEKVRNDTRQGTSVALCDIMFCDTTWRRRLESELEATITWIFFANNPWRCAKNCLRRFYFGKRQSNWLFELRKILELSRVYQPEGNIRPVVGADANPPECSAE